MKIHFIAFSYLYLLWAVFFLFMILWYAHRKRNRALDFFVQKGTDEGNRLSGIGVRRLWKNAFHLAALVFLVLALARPAGNPQPKKIERYGRDVVFLLDVSQSMLAEDLKPNRLAAARLAILDCIEALRGDRVALVSFAGRWEVECPLTLDYPCFRWKLNALSPESISDRSTRIGDALHGILSEVFLDREKKFKDVILLSDGEEEGPSPLEAATELGKRKIRLLALGLGDDQKGARIPIRDQRGLRFLTYEGQEVWSKLHATTLRQMVDATPGGKYFHIATGTIDLGAVYTQLVALQEKRALESETVEQYEERFPFFLTLALLFFAGAEAIKESKISKKSSGKSL